VLDIDEAELEVVRGEFGEFDELDEFTVKGRRRNVLEALSEEVELVDLSARDRAVEPDGAAPAPAVVAEGDDEDDDEDDDEAEATAVSASDSQTSAPTPSEQAATATTPEGEPRRKRRRRRRKKKPAEEVPTPALMVPPHKDFWEAWASQFSYEMFEDDQFFVGREPPPEEPEPEPETRAARPPRSHDRERDRERDRGRDREPQREDDGGETVTVALNLGRAHGKKAADIRELLAGELDIAGRSVRNLTVGDDETVFDTSPGNHRRLVDRLAGRRIDGVDIAVRLLESDDGPGDDDTGEADAAPVVESPPAVEATDAGDGAGP
jgi:hypothetical protein